MSNGVLPAMPQRGLTVIAETGEQRLPALRAAIRAAAFFPQMETVHFAAFVIVPRVGTKPPRLVLETNYDGEPDQHIADLVQHGAGALDDIYQHCAGFDARGAPDQKRAFFRQHAVPSAAFYVGLPGRSVKDIRNAIAVYDEAQQFLDTYQNTPSFNQRTAAEVWNDLVTHFRGPNRRNVPMRSPMSQRRIRWLVLRNLFTRALPAWAGLVLLIALLPIFRIYEYFESRGDRDCPRDPLMNYVGLNAGPQNHLCVLSTARPSLFRRTMLRIALFTTGILAKRIFIQGSLDTITTVHFARWTRIDQGERLLFFSNFDASWSSYLNEFEDPPHLNAIWSNTLNFPPTRWVLRGGAHLAARFEDHDIREYIRAEFFYNAYPRYSVPNLMRYLNLRDALAR